MTQQSESMPADAPPAATTHPDVIEVSRVAPQPITQVWQRLTTREGVEALLGPGAMLGSKGEPWRSQDGSCGVTRSYHPQEQVRVSWHADQDAPTTMVDLQLAPEGDGTRLHLRHERLTAEMPQDTLRRRWQDALARLTG